MTEATASPVEGADRRWITRKWRRLRSWREQRRERVPDLVKLRGLVEVRHFEVERLLGDNAALASRARELLENVDVKTTDLEHYHAHFDKLDELEPLLGSVHRISVLLETEQQRRAGERSVDVAAVFKEGEIGRLLDEYRSEKTLAEEELKDVRERLSRLARERNDKERHDRVAAKLKARLVNRFFLPLLFALTVSFVAAAALAEHGHDWRRLVFAAVAGALGSMVSGARRLRDMFAMDDVRRFSQWIWLQPVFGAAAALVVFLVYLQTKETADWRSAGLAGFAAGFSEPFFLKTVERLTGSESKPEQARAASDVR